LLIFFIYFSFIIIFYLLNDLELWRKKQSDVMRFLNRVRVWEFRQLPVCHRISRPTRSDKAHHLGYKAKQGYLLYRIRVRRGSRKRPVKKGITYHKPKWHGVNQLTFSRNLRSTAEARVGKRCPNLRILNSYWVGQDGVYKWYEVILVDPDHNAIRNDPRINWIVKPVHKHREIHGLTSAGRHHRSLMVKGYGASKVRPSRRANWKRRNTIILHRYR
jgi:large subunit ribosomal protein L15e